MYGLSPGAIKKNEILLSNYLCQNINPEGCISILEVLNPTVSTPWFPCALSLVPFPCSQVVGAARAAVIISWLYSNYVCQIKFSASICCAIPVFQVCEGLELFVAPR